MRVNQEIEAYYNWVDPALAYATDCSPETKGGSS